MKLFKNYKFKHLTLFLIGIFIVVNLSVFDFLNPILFNLRHLPLIGSIIAGILYVAAPTTALGILILFDLSESLSILEISILAGLGGVIGDFAIFRFFKDDLLSEITLIYNKVGGRHVTKILNHKYLRWSIPIIGIIIIASPFPDEIGVSLMGITKIKTYQFLLLSLILDITAVYLLIQAYILIK